MSQEAIPPPKPKPAAAASPEGSGAPAATPETTPDYANTYVAPSFVKAPPKYKSQVPKWTSSQDDVDRADKIEDLILGLPEFQAVKADSKSILILQKFLQKVAPRVDLGRTAHQMLETYADIEVNAEKIAEFLRSNSYYEFQFLKVIQSIKKSEDPPSAEVALILLGMQNSRNLLIAMQLVRSVKLGHPEWKDGKLQLEPKNILKYATKLEEVCLAKKVPFPEVTFNAGVLFDLLALIAEELAEDKKKIAAFIDAVFAHGLKTADIALELSKTIPDMPLKKFLYSACVLHDLGKVVLAILEPTYFDFNDEVAKKNVSRSLRHYAEIKRYGVAHPMMGSLTCQNFDFFKNIQSVLLHQHEPYLVKSKPHYQLAALVCLATNIANRFVKAKDAADPILSEWKGLELVQFRYDAKQLVTLVAKMGAS